MRPRRSFHQNPSSVVCTSNAFVLKRFRTLLRNGAIASPFPSITCALFPVQRRVGACCSLSSPTPPSALLLHSSLQICTFIFNQLRDAPPATLFFSDSCIVAGGWHTPLRPSCNNCVARNEDQELRRSATRREGLRASRRSSRPWLPRWRGVCRPEKEWPSRRTACSPEARVSRDPEDRC